MRKVACSSQCWHGAKSTAYKPPTCPGEAEQRKDGTVYFDAWHEACPKVARYMCKVLKSSDYCNSDSIRTVKQQYVGQKEIEES